MSRLKLITEEEEMGSVVGENLADWLGHALGESPGIPIDPERAKATPCNCYTTPEGKELCWSPGIIGMLAEEQVKVYCPSKKVIPGLPKRVAAFREAAATCSKEIRELPKGERLIFYLKCMGVELKKKGEEL